MFFPLQYKASQTVNPNKTKNFNCSNWVDLPRPFQQDMFDYSAKAEAIEAKVNNFPELLVFQLLVSINKHREHNILPWKQNESHIKVPNPLIVRRNFKISHFYYFLHICPIEMVIFYKLCSKIILPLREAGFSPQLVVLFYEKQFLS